MFRSFILAILGWTWLLSIGFAPEVSCDEVSERFARTVADSREEWKLPGVTAAYVLPDGKSFATACGFADVAKQRPMPPDAKMLSGSTGKTFAAMVLLDLAREGVIRLDDPLSMYLGEERWFDRLPNGPDITIRHLMGHRAGLADHVELPTYAIAVRLAMSFGNRDAILPHERLVYFILDHEAKFPAGEGFAYTDTGYILLGLVIEKATGNTYYDELTERILQPLELSRTLPANSRDIPGIVAGYPRDDVRQIFGLGESTMKEGRLQFNPSVEWTGGGLASNPLDLARFCKLVCEGDAIEGEYVDEMLPDPEDSKSKYGLGIFIYRTESGILYGHGGWFPGYSSAMGYFPKERVSIAIQTNTDRAQINAPYVMEQMLRSVVSDRGNASTEDLRDGQAE